jgi:hypothetical protein
MWWAFIISLAAAENSTTQRSCSPGFVYRWRSSDSYVDLPESEAVAAAGPLTLLNAMHTFQAELQEKVDQSLEEGELRVHVIGASEHLEADMAWEMFLSPTGRPSIATMFGLGDRPQLPPRVVVTVSPLTGRKPDAVWESTPPKQAAKPKSKEPKTLTKAEKKKKKCDALFQAMDTNGDGEISMEEFTVAMENADFRGCLSVEVKNDDVQGVFKQLDQDNSGSVSIPEFMDGVLRAATVKATDHKPVDPRAPGVFMEIEKDWPYQMAMKNQYDEADKEIPHIALALNPGYGFEPTLFYPVLDFLAKEGVPVVTTWYGPNPAMDVLRMEDPDPRCRAPRVPGQPEGSDGAMHQVKIPQSKNLVTLFSRGIVDQPHSPPLADDCGDEGGTVALLNLAKTLRYSFDRVEVNPFPYCDHPDDWDCNSNGKVILLGPLPQLENEDVPPPKLELPVGGDAKPPAEKSPAAESKTEKPTNAKSASLAQLDGRPANGRPASAAREMAMARAGSTPPLGAEADEDYTELQAVYTKLLERQVNCRIPLDRANYTWNGEAQHTYDTALQQCVWETQYAGPNEFFLTHLNQTIDTFVDACLAVTQGCDIEMQTSTARDPAGYRCGDWYGYNCYVSPGYSEENLAKVREECPACCAVSSVPPTDSRMVFANNGDRRGERAYEEQWEKQREGERGPLSNITELLAKLLAPNTTAKGSNAPNASDLGGLETLIFLGDGNETPPATKKKPPAKKPTPKAAPKKPPSKTNAKEVKVPANDGGDAAMQAMQKVLRDIASSESAPEDYDDDDDDEPPAQRSLPKKTPAKKKAAPKKK